MLLAENREALLDIMYTLKRYLRDGGLILSAEKSKVLVFNRKRKEKMESWKWENKELEKVQCFEYLGFVFNKKENCVHRIKELAKKGENCSEQGTGIGGKNLQR